MVSNAQTPVQACGGESPNAPIRSSNALLGPSPPRSETTIRVTPNPAERAFYEALRRDAIAGLEGEAGRPEAGRMQVLAAITRLRQAAVDPRLVDESAPAGSKLDALLTRLLALRDEGHRALVFSQFLGGLAAVCKRLEQAGIRYLELDGATPAAQRAARIAAFQRGEGDVFVMSLKAGGVGINLTAADYVIHLDPWWNPAVEDQASARAHRMGQQRPVTIYRLVAADTIEEKILALHQSKRELASGLLQGLDEASHLDVDTLRALLE